MMTIPKIKFIILSILLLTAVNLSLHAQEKSLHKKVTFGISIGGSISTSPLRSDMSIPVPSNLGYADPLIMPMGGLNITFHLPKNLAVQTELNYTEKGGKREQYTHKFRYIEIPVALIKDFNIGKTSFYAGGGGYAATMVGSVKTLNQVTVSDIVDNFPYGHNGIVERNKYRKLDCGARLKLGYNATRNLGINMGYDYGLVNVLDNEDNSYINNRSLTLAISLKLN